MDIHLDALTGLPFLPDDGNGEPRRLGRLTPNGPMALPSFRQYHAPIPRSEWRPISMFDAFDVCLYDQGNTGSCVGHATGTAFTMIWLMQGGAPTRFSPCYIYGQLNGGVDRGASIGDSITALQVKGVCLESTVPEGMIFARDFPANADAEASRFRLIEAYQTTDPADVATALQMGYSVADSVMVGRTFAGLDGRGMAGIDPGPGNHAIVKGGMDRLPDGTWVYLNQNSWGRWGIDGTGRFLTTDDHIHCQTQYEAVVIRVVTAG